MSEPEPAKTWLDNLETWSRIFAALAIPVLIALGGWFIHSSLSRQSTNKDYVDLATQILEKKAESPADEAIRDWAVDLLDATSPVQMLPATKKSLKSGQISFGPLKALIKTSATGGLAISRDARFIAAGSQDKTVKIIDGSSDTGAVLKTLSGHTDAVTSVAFSPDASQVLSGSLDCTARLWNTTTGQNIKHFKYRIQFWAWRLKTKEKRLWFAMRKRWKFSNAAVRT